MKAVLIGSAVYSNTNLDIDLIADQEFFQAFASQVGCNPESNPCTYGQNHVWKVPGEKIIELTVPNDGTAFKYLLNQDYNETVQIKGLEVNKPSLAILAVLKKAHLILPHQWKKHMTSYLWLKQELGVSYLKPSEFGLSELYRIHRREVKKISKDHPKLNVKKDDFFEEAEFKIFDHDTIHQAVAIDDKPAYTLIQDGEVWCSFQKWKNLTPQQKLNCVIEEASVLALERSVIPHLLLNRGFRGATWAYHTALMKICTTITSGFFRTYAIEVYEQAVKAQPNFVKDFFDGWKSGLVKQIEKEEMVNG